MGVAELRKLVPYEKKPKCWQCHLKCREGETESGRPYFICEYHQHRWGITFIWNDLIGVNDRNPACDCDHPMRWTPYNKRPGGFYACAIANCRSKRHDEPRPEYLDMSNDGASGRRDSFDSEAEFLRIKREIPDELRCGDIPARAANAMDVDSPRRRSPALSRSPPACGHVLPPTSFVGPRAPPSPARSDSSVEEIFVDAPERHAPAPFPAPAPAGGLPSRPRTARHDHQTPRKKQKQTVSAPGSRSTLDGWVQKKTTPSSRVRSPSSTASISRHFQDLVVEPIRCRLPGIVRERNTPS